MEAESCALLMQRQCVASAGLPAHVVHRMQEVQQRVHDSRSCAPVAEAETELQVVQRVAAETLQGFALAAMKSSEEANAAADVSHAPKQATAILQSLQQVLGG